MTDYSELFEVAYKWILAPPKRDVRALCATQSTGTTKQRQKKKKTEATSTGLDVSAPLASAGNETVVGQAQPTLPPAAASSNTPNPPLPLAPLPNLGQASAAWSRNPALAQYYQYVWQTQQQNPTSQGSEESFKSIMQRMQAVPAQLPAQPPALQTTLLPSEHRREIVLPPPEFNMGQPPPSLLPQLHKSADGTPQPAPYTNPVQALQLLPNPPPSHPLHIPPYKPRPAINIQQNPWSAQWSGTSQSQQWNNEPFRGSATPETQQPPPALKQVHPRPLAPSPPTQPPIPPMPSYHGIMPAQSNNQAQAWREG